MSLAASLSRTHRVHERGVEQDEHGARQHVDEDDAEHVVGDEVDVRVTFDERRKLDVTGGHVQSGAVHVGVVYYRWYATTGIVVVPLR